MEYLKAKDIRVFNRRQSYGVRIGSVQSHYLVVSIPSADQVLCFQGAIYSSADADEIAITSTSDLLNSSSVKQMRLLRCFIPK